jgi:hypothetical protein
MLVRMSGLVPVELSKLILAAEMVGVALFTISEALVPCEPPDAANERLSKTYPYAPKCPFG